MADKAISELVAAPAVTPDSLFVLQQDNTAKKLTAQVLENWLLSFAEGHGGIQTHGLINTEGLVKTYRFTFADQTYMDFDVVDGRGVKSVKPTSTNGLVVTYTITYNDGTTDTFTVTNGAKGDKGDRADIWVKYASQKPTASSHSFGDVADAWIGITTGHNMDAAPTDWQQYTWFQWKGEKGDTGEPATLVSSEITYQAGDSGTIIPSGNWSSSVPTVTPGRYLWTRQVLRFNTGNPITSYSVSRFGIDGTGAVSSVAGVAPDENGNVPLDAAGVKALPIGGGTMEGPINMNGQKLTGLNEPTADDEPATKGYADNLKPDLTGYATETYVNDAVKTAAPRNLLDNSDFTNPVNQRGKESYTGNNYTIDRWRTTAASTTHSITEKGLKVSSDTSAIHSLQTSLENPKRLVGKTVTLCAFVEENNANAELQIAIYYGAGSVNQTQATPISLIVPAGTTGLIAVSGVLPDMSGYGYANACIRVRNGMGDFTVKWMALYEGEYTADTLPEYQPKGCGAELAECQRYYQVIANNGICYAGYVTGGSKTVQFGMKIAPMRIDSPSIESNNVDFTIRGSAGYLAQNSVEYTISLYIKNAAIGYIAFSVVFATELAENNVPVGIQAGGKLVLSADL